MNFLTFLQTRYILVFDFIKSKKLKKIKKELKGIDNYTKYYKLKKNDVVFDIGSYHGWFVLKNYNPFISFFCFDIDPKNFKFLKNNILKLNKDNVNINNLGVFNKTGEVGLYGLRVGSMGSKINFVNKRKNKNIQAKTITLKDFIKSKNIQKIDFMKIDVEGSELEILNDSIDILKKYKPNLAIASYHIRDKQITYIKVEEILKKVGYSKVFSENKKHLTTYAIR